MASESGPEINEEIIDFTNPSENGHKHYEPQSPITQQERDLQEENFGAAKISRWKKLGLAVGGVLTAAGMGAGIGAGIGLLKKSRGGDGVDVEAVPNNGGATQVIEVPPVGSVTKVPGTNVEYPTITPTATEKPNPTATPTEKPQPTRTPEPTKTQQTIDTSVEHLKDADLVFLVQVLDSLNAKRQESNLPKLVLNAQLTRFAEEDAQIIWEARSAGTIDQKEMARLESLLPDRNKVREYQGVIHRSFYVDGYLDYYYPLSDPPEWVRDSTHQASLLNPKVTEVGIGCIRKVEPAKTSKGNAVDVVCIVGLGEPGAFGPNVY